MCLILDDLQMGKEMLLLNVDISEDFCQICTELTIERDDLYIKKI